MKELQSKPINVTEAFLPPQEEYQKFINEIYRTHILSNQGPFVTRLEGSLRKHLDVPQLSAVANGTLALQLALHQLGLKGKKVITTPFTYVATLSSLLWEDCEPVFADIDPSTFCLSPEMVEQTLRYHPDAAGVLPVHVFGLACDIDAFANLGAKYGLKILYDGAHAFGSIFNDKSLLTYGDASICSFHATKLFHTIEGGCIITQDGKNAENISFLRAFGHQWENYKSLGINAKLSEMHAAMGLCVLKHVPEILKKRAQISGLYDKLLNIDNNQWITRPKLVAGLQWNHAYYPVLFKSEELLLKVMNKLKQENIFPRRYFYPSLTSLPYSPKQACPVADDIARRILCLPFWADMAEEIVNKVATGVLQSL